MTVINPNWSKKPNDLRIRQDIPNASDTNAARTIIRNTRFLGGATGAGVGGIAGAGTGAVTGLLLSETSKLSDPISIAIGSSIGVAGIILGGIGGALFGHKKARIDLAEAELGIVRQNPSSTPFYMT